MSDGMSLVDLLRRSAIARKQELKGADVEAGNGNDDTLDESCS